MKKKYLKDGKFDVRSVKAIQEYIFDKTGVTAEVLKTSSSIVVVANGETIKISCYWIYTLNEEDLAPIIEKLKLDH